MTHCPLYEGAVYLIGRAAGHGLVTPLILNLRVAQQGMHFGLKGSGLQGAEELGAAWARQQHRILENVRARLLGRRGRGELDTQVAAEYRLAGNAECEAGRYVSAVAEHYTQGITWIQGLPPHRKIISCCLETDVRRI